MVIMRFRASMVGANIKAETMALMDQRSAVEEEMNIIIHRLRRPGGPGLSGNLVDREGFPRADIDISATLSDRQRLAVLKNNFKNLTEKIEKNLHLLYAPRDSSLPQKRNADGEQVVQRATQIRMGAPSQTEPVPMEEDRQARIPFAEFDEVTDGSPAARDGIQVGDRLIKFGNVEGGADVLRRLAMEGQNNENRTVQVVLLRRGVEQRLSVTPRRWEGNGLLGCHLRPL